MGVWAGPFLVASLLLAAAGALKAYHPAPTVGALRTMGLAVPAAAVRVGGGLEAALGVSAAVTGDRVLAALVAVSYVAFTGFVVLALVRRVPIGSCGCFGKEDTPPSPVHLVVNVSAIVAATAVALGPGGSLAEVLGDQPAFGLPFLVFVAGAAYLSYLALTVLPQLNRLARASRGA